MSFEWQKKQFKRLFNILYWFLCGSFTLLEMKTFFGWIFGQCFLFCGCLCTLRIYSRASMRMKLVWSNIYDGMMEIVCRVSHDSCPMFGTITIKTQEIGGTQRSVSIGYHDSSSPELIAWDFGIILWNLDAYCQSQREFFMKTANASDWRIDLNLRKIYSNLARILG